MLPFEGFAGYLCERVKPGYEREAPPPKELFVSLNPVVLQTAEGLTLSTPPGAVGVIYLKDGQYVILDCRTKA